MRFALSFCFNLEITRLQVISLFTIIKTYWSWNLNAIACLVFYLYKSELDLNFKKLHWPGWRNNKFCQNMFLIQYQVWELMFDNIVTTYLIIYLHWSLRNYFKVIQVHEEKFISWTACLLLWKSKKNYKPLQVRQFRKKVTLFNSDILYNLVFKNTFLRHKKHKNIKKFFIQ